jgi:endonuclease-8
MPEGDTIFRTARTLARAFEGRVITGFRSTYPLLTRFDDDTPLTGQTVVRVEPRGKFLLIHFSGGGTLVTHLLMSGSWHIYRHGERWQKPQAQMRIVIENSEFVAVGFKVPVAEMHTAESLRRNKRIPSLDRDVLREEFNVNAAVERLLAMPNKEIAEALLNQRITAGVGNEFKSEICFVARINPFEHIAALKRERLEDAVNTAQQLLKDNVLEDSGEQMLTYAGRWRRTTHASNPEDHAWVYERAGQPCRRCGERIRRRLQGPNARATFWCARCQPRLDGSDVDG